MREWFETSPLERAGRVRAWWVVLGWCGFVAALMVLPGSGADGWILCPFRALTGYSCPGCGMTRACTAALHGQWWHSLGFHPLGIGVVGWFGASALRRGWELRKGRALGLGPKAKRWVHMGSVAGFIFVVGFGGLRLTLELLGILTPV